MSYAARISGVRDNPLTADGQHTCSQLSLFDDKGIYLFGKQCFFIGTACAQGEIIMPGLGFWLEYWDRLIILRALCPFDESGQMMDIRVCE
ncbi:hypothetical protein [Erwinia sp. ErVv1]|uniref:hypothetical protein n=1 Tax=Erwinia sp. ErVv1 TaxID=1603299 RepID=UPI00082A053B|nr:hypothetical protein [Erwinia sp. ErVv1]